MSLVVHNTSGRPVSGALVAAWPVELNTYEAVPADRATTDQRGAVILNLDPAREYSITATAAGHAPGYALTSELRDQFQERVADQKAGKKHEGHAVLTLDGAPTGALTGTLVRASGKPAVDGMIRVIPKVRKQQEIYLVLPDSHGAFRVDLRYGTFFLKGNAPRATYSIERANISEREAKVTIQLRPPSAATPADAVATLRRSVVPVQMQPRGPDQPEGDRLSRILCDARVVGIGESTHGSSEFTRLKGQVLLHLAQTCAFNVLLVEAGMSALAAVDDYVLTGRGDPAALLHEVGSWPFVHEEFLGLVLAVREYNARAATPIRIVGIDPFKGRISAPALLAWIGRVDAKLQARVTDAFSVLERRDFYSYYRTAPDGVRTSVRAALDEVAELVRVSGSRSTPEHQRAALHLRSLQSIERRFSATPENAGDVREQLLAEHTRWAIDEYIPGAKAVITAHNGHVLLARSVWKVDALGDFLSDTYGQRYVSVGVFFGKGSFRALDRRSGKITGLHAFSVGDPLDGSIEQQLDRVGVPVFLLDLTTLESARMQKWLESELPHRELGSMFLGEENLRQRIAAASSYHVLAYISDITAIEPLKKPDK